MPDMNALFIKYDSKIALLSTKKDSLRTSRNTLRGKIKKYFKDNDMNIPKFSGQGSYMMNTIVNPLPEKEYDIDDGIYLTSYNNLPEDQWVTPSTAHSWILKAVDGHTNEPAQDKSTCIRVIYAKSYHIDLPSYIMKDEKAYLAHKSKGWIVSDPKALTKWFRDKLSKSDEQMRRVVRYLKAWKDYQNINSVKVDVPGLAFTILIGNNFYKCSDRDDKSLLGTLKNIINNIELNFVCYKPVEPTDENLFDGYSETKRKSILKEMKDLMDKVNDAINKEDELEASELLIEEFGDRFPKGQAKAKNNTYIRTEAPAILNNDGHSA